MAFVFAATAAALLILVPSWSGTAPPKTLHFHDMSGSTLHDSCGFQPLINLMCRLFGIAFTLAGCARFYRAMKHIFGTPDFIRFKRRARIYASLGFAGMTFPFLQRAMLGHPPYHISYYVNGRHVTGIDITQMQDNLILLTAACWYWGVMEFFSGSLMLSKAEQLNGDPTGDPLKEGAAFRLLTGFVMMSAPIAYAWYLGAAAWPPAGE